MRLLFKKNNFVDIYRIEEGDTVKEIVKKYCRGALEKVSTS